MIHPFTTSQLHSYILPILQGHFQLAKFRLPTNGNLDNPQPKPSTVGDVPMEGNKDEVEVDYVVISRRSRDRAGLRYQRRGIDDKGFVANFVETEAIVRLEVCLSHAFMPYYNSQSPATRKGKCFLIRTNPRFKCLVSLLFYHIA